MITRLRDMRKRYGISLAELELASGLCNQQLSRLELGVLPRSTLREQRVGEALAALIAARKADIESLEQELHAEKGRLLIFVEEADA